MKCMARLVKDKRVRCPNSAVVILPDKYDRPTAYCKKHADQQKKRVNK